MPPPHDGNEHLPFERLIQVERLKNDTFKSIALPYHPGGAGGSHGAAFGGHVFMQAAWAACHTVAEGFLLSNVTGHFLLPALPTIRYTYTVQNVRTGRSYCTKYVHVTQKEDQGIMFTCTCVFKKAESSPIDVQAESPLRGTYAAVLAGKRPEDFRAPASMDTPKHSAIRDQTGKNEAFPGLDMRKADMLAYNAQRHPLSRRQLLFYRTLGSLPTENNLNMHLCAHLYASDRNGLFNLANHLEVGDVYAGIGSLVHQVSFHYGSDQDVLFPAPDSGLWFTKEDWMGRYTGGRVMHHGRLWAPNGVHIASVMQDGLLRLPRGKEVEMREIERRWKDLPVDGGRAGKASKL